MPEIRRPFAMNLAALPDGKVTIEDRRPKKPAGLGKQEWKAERHVSATFYVGMDRGERAKNRIRACATDPEKYPVGVVDERFRAMRSLILIERGGSAKDFGASRTIMEGWYGGKPKGEHSAAYQIIWNADYPPPGEETEELFKESMRRVASGVSALLCQDEVLVSFDVPSGKSTESYSADADDRKRADTVRMSEGFKGVGDARLHRTIRHMSDDDLRKELGAETVERFPGMTRLELVQLVEGRRRSRR